MNQNEVKENVGKIVYLNGKGDLAFKCGLRRFINTNNPLSIIKLTREGMAYLKSKDDKGDIHLVSVPPKNVQLNKVGYYDNQLKECPFKDVDKEMGHKPYIQEGEGYDVPYVGCTCGARGPVSSNKKMAIKCWNMMNPK